MHITFKRTLLLTAILPFLLLLNVHAHDASYGFSSWKIKENTIEASISIDTLSIIELGNIDKDNDKQISQDELIGASSIIMSYIDEKLELYVNNKERLRPNLIDLKIPDFTVVQINLLFESKETIEQIEINYQLFYEKSNNNHKNIATINTSGEKPIEHVFSINEPIWSGDKVSTGSFFSTVKQFIILGVEHILIGYDHILFLIALIVIGLRLKEAVKVITAFTVAHSITLILAALEIIHLNSKFVESVIALSICYVAIENIVMKESRHRWVIAFIFGLIHGFGFAGVLTEIGIPQSNFISALLAFNIGVELGQLLLFILIMPVLYVLHKKFSKNKTKVVISLLVFLFGILWFIERVFNLSFMPL